MNQIDPFAQKGNWYKANFHTHTAESDGQTPVDQRIEQYRKGGYSILAISDHNRVVNVAPQSTDDLLLVNASEIGSPGFRPDHKFHILCVNIPVDFDCECPDDPNNLAAKVNAAGGLAFLAHPYWSACNAEDIRALEGFAGFEVWNSSQWGNCHSVASVHWDIALDSGIELCAIASDDTHSAPGGDYDLCAGWTMLKMPELSINAMMSALSTGCYYASTGPEIYDFSLKNGICRAEFSSATNARFMGWGPCGKRIWDVNGGEITSAEVEVKDAWRYVRLEVEDASGKVAWANPFYLKNF